MSTSNDLDSVAARAIKARQSLVWAVAILVIALLYRGLLIAPSIGIERVHLPTSMDVPIAVDALGHGIGAIPRAIAVVLELASLAAGAGLIWALCVRRAQVAKVCLLFLLVKSILGPVPIFPSAPPSGVDLPVAERLIGPVSHTTTADNAWKRYVAAQVAYLEGDRRTARLLSEGLDADDLGSWREAPYRIPLLQGREPETTNVCLKLGCLPSRSLGPARTATLATAAIAALWAAMAAGMWLLLRARIERIYALRSAIRARGMPG